MSTDGYGTRMTTTKKDADAAKTDAASEATPETAQTDAKTGTEDAQTSETDARPLPDDVPVDVTRGTALAETTEDGAPLYGRDESVGLPDYEQARKDNPNVTPSAMFPPETQREGWGESEE